MPNEQPPPVGEPGGASLPHKRFAPKMVESNPPMLGPEKQRSPILVFAAIWLPYHAARRGMSCHVRRWLEMKSRTKAWVGCAVAMSAMLGTALPAVADDVTWDRLVNSDKDPNNLRPDVDP
jgi:hypothetical protein